MERLTYFLTIFLFIFTAYSCSLKKDYVLLDKEKIEAENNVLDKECIGNYDDDVLTSVLRENNFNYVVKNNNIYVERKEMSHRNFFDKINHDIQNKVQYKNAPEGYVLFKYRRLNIKTNEYETRPLDSLDKNLLPDIIEKNGFDYILRDDCLYVERELIDNQDFLSKIVHILDFERGDAPL